MAKEAGIKIDNCMKVMKFGGTSVGSVNSILSVKQIVEAVEEFSAMEVFEHSGEELAVSCSMHFKHGGTNSF